MGGCIKSTMASRFKDITSRRGNFKPLSMRFKVHPHWLREIKVTAYVGGTRTTDFKGRKIKEWKIPQKEAVATVAKGLNCKFGFLQSKDGHVLKIFHAKNSGKGCVKIKTQM